MINRAWVWNAKLIFLYHGNKYNCMCIRIWRTLKLSPLFGWCKMCVEWICILWVVFLILLINVFVFLWYMYGFHVTCSMVKPKANFHTVFSKVFLFLFLYSRNSDQQSGDYANRSQVVSIFWQLEKNFVNTVNRLNFVTVTTRMVCIVTTVLIVVSCTFFC